MRHIRLHASLAFIVIGSAICNAQTTIRPTVTLSQLTANNTSASDNFKGLPNGVAAPGNVSKQPLDSLLYPGATTKIYAHLLAWFGGKNHIDIGYKSTDSGQVQRQFTDMVSRGISGVVITWNGTPETQQAAALFLKQAEQHAGFDFALEEDVSAVNKYASSVSCDVTPQVIQDLTTFYKNFEQSSAYLRINNRPVVFFFGLEKYYVDWDRVRKAVSGNPIFMIRNSGAFAQPQSDGGFSWTEQNRTNPLDEMLSYLDRFYAAAVKSPGKVTVGSVYPGFNDNSASWGRNRIIHQHCGQTWLDTFAEVGNFYSSRNQLRALQIVTWNDYEEGSAIEAGIDNCVVISPSISGGKLHWTVDGNEQAIDHYTVFISTDGKNLMPLADLPVGSRFFDLLPLKLSPGTYVLYVRAVGKPSFLNKISEPAKFNPSNQPPVAQLTLSATSGNTPLTITASSAGSTDAEGSVISSTIDFGDGTQVDAFSATHTYATPGTYTITATVFDNLGLFSKAQAQVVATPLQPGVAISSPASSASVTSPMHVTATVASGNPTALMNVSVDGQVLYTTFAGVVDKDITVANGAHNITVQAVDSSGATLQSILPVNVQTPGQPPVTVLDVSPIRPPPAANEVLACTAASRDPDGDLNASTIDFGDASPSDQGPAGVHAYSAPGSYTVQATLTDDTGRSSTASQAIGVGGPFTLGVSPAQLEVSRGATASYKIIAMPQEDAFNNPVSLSCSNTPPGSACSFSPSSITPGTSGASAMLTITTGSAALKTPSFFNASEIFAFAFAVVLVGSSREHRHKLALILTMLGLTVLFAVMSGCGGGGGSDAAPASAASNNFTITITGTSGSTQVSTKAQLRVH